MRVEILSCFWGDEHFDLFKAATLRSLAWKENRKALHEVEATWNIFTDEKNFFEVEKVVDALMPEVEINLGSAKDLRKYTDQTQSALVWQIERCLENDKRLLFAPPDTIFGDGTIPGLLAGGREKGSCVVIPHPRVLKSILPKLTIASMPNEELVTLAWEHLHRSWTDAEVGHKLRNSFIGGVSWEKISKDLYSVKHVLPTVYFADFTKEDLTYFQTTGCFGAFDHTWAADILIPRGRQRYLGSSDAAFAVEITDKEKNIPPITPGDPDTFWKTHAHNEHNKMVRAIFRGV